MNANPTPALLFAARAREITEFCLAHGGKAFANWPVPKLFAYVFFHVVARTVFVARKGGNILAVAFAWSNPETEIRKRAAAGAPQFEWRRTADEADSLFVAQVIVSAACRARSAGLLSRLAQQVAARWPDLERRKVFTYRRGELVELKAEVIRKLSGEGKH